MNAAPSPQDRRPGMVWFAQAKWADSASMSPNYLRDWKAQRPPLVIALPDGTTWCPDQCPAWGSNVDEGWKVTGDIPNISAHPSIGKPGYHGWLRDGVLSDDLEGRVYTVLPE